jgi:thiol-disulfide isomerase/thioredoxin
MRKKIFFLLIFIFFLSFFSLKEIFSAGKVEIYFFWGQGCPHCAKEKPFLEELKQKYPQLEVKDFEVYYSRENQELFKKVAQAYKTQPVGVPMTFIGKDFIVGFGTKETTGKQIENLIQNCLTNICPSPEEILAAGGIDKWKPGEEPPKEESKPVEETKENLSPLQNHPPLLLKKKRKFQFRFSERKLKFLLSLLCSFWE